MLKILKILPCKQSYYNLLVNLFAWYFFLANNSFALVTVALGPIKNESDKVKLDEIELRLPVEIGKLMKGYEKQVSLINPKETTNILAKKQIELKYNYLPKELSQVYEALKADAFLTGTVQLVELNQIKVTLWLYVRENNRQFKFVFIEPPATILKTIVFTVVTILSQYLIKKEGERWLVSPVKPGSKIALFSDASPRAMNRAAMFLLERGYQVSALGYVDFSTKEEKELKLFYDITSKEVSYTEVDPDMTELAIITLSPLDRAQKKVQNTLENYNLVLNYTQNFSTLETAALESLYRTSKADFLLLLHSNPTTAFARGIALTTGKLFYLRRNLPVSKEKGEELETALLGFLEDLSMLPPLPDISNVAAISPLAKSGASDELATVAILDFFDRTKQKRFAWLRESLSSAVSESMQLVFEYRRAENQKEKMAASLVARGFNSQILSQVQQTTGADFLIFGDYTFDPKEQLLLIEARVYDLYSLKEIGIATESTPIDNRMFNAVDNIANKIVQHIYKVATAP